MTLRSLVDVSGGGRFSGVLTGGNGRPPGEGQDEYYEFNVPSGVNDITANVKLANDAGDPVGEYLISPDGDTLGYGQNTPGRDQRALADRVHPQPGAGHLDADRRLRRAGGRQRAVRAVHRGHRVQRRQASAAGLPDSASTTLAAGKPVTVPVTITNTGDAPEDFFIDPRLNTDDTVTLPAVSPTSDTVSLPMTSYFPTWFVPTETSSVSVTQTASLPAMFDYSPFAATRTSPARRAAAVRCARRPSRPATPRPAAP